MRQPLGSTGGGGGGGAAQNECIAGIICRPQPTLGPPVIGEKARSWPAASRFGPSTAGSSRAGAALTCSRRDPGQHTHSHSLLHHQTPSLRTRRPRIPLHRHHRWSRPGCPTTLRPSQPSTSLLALRRNAGHTPFFALASRHTLPVPSGPLRSLEYLRIPDFIFRDTLERFAVASNPIRDCWAAAILSSSSHNIAKTPSPTLDFSRTDSR